MTKQMILAADRIRFSDLNDSQILPPHMSYVGILSLTLSTQSHVYPYGQNHPPLPILFFQIWNQHNTPIAQNLSYLS